VQTTVAGGRVVLINSAQSKLPNASIGIHGGGTISTDARDPHGEHAEIPQFEMRVDLDNSKQEYVSGQRAWVRLTVGKAPLIYQGYVRFLQLIETKNRSSSMIQL
jgi:hypothetical protein